MRRWCALAAGLYGALAHGQTPPAGLNETLTYRVEWRLIQAGTVKFTARSAGTPERPAIRAQMELESAGLVSRLFKVQDTYTGDYDANLCAQRVRVISSEGKRRHDTQIEFDRNRKKALYTDRDLVKNSLAKSGEIDIPACVYDTVGALIALRRMPLEPGKSIELPVTDGRKFAMVRAEAQERETLLIDGKQVKTVRLEALLFNGVIYARPGRLFLWVTDDEKRTPVQFRFRMNFPVGTVTLTLDKIE